MKTHAYGLFTAMSGSNLIEGMVRLGICLNKI